MQYIIEQFPKLVTLLTFCVITLTVCYEWGYFSVIGMQFLTAFTTQDFLSSAVFWLPPSLVTVGISVVIFLTVLRSDNFQPKNPGDIFKTPFLKWLMTWFFEIIIVLAAAHAFFFDSPDSGVFLAFALVVWYLVLRYIFSHEKAKSAVSEPTQWIIRIFPIILLTCYWFGRIAAHSDISPTAERFTLHGKTQLVEANVSILRMLEKGVLVYRQEANTAELVRWEYVVRFEKLVPARDVRSYSCRWFGLYCKPIGDASKKPTPDSKPAEK